jgi:uncharacterized RDD family membrane protein YckC
MIAPVLPCPICDVPTPYDWDRCGNCGAQRLVAADGSHAGFVRLAAPWRRVVAALIDLALFAVPAVIVLFVLPDRIADPTPAAGGEEGLMAVIIFAALLYGPVSIGANGRTLGKRLLTVHVVGDDGRAPSYPRAAVREGVGKVLLIASLAALPLLVALIGDALDAQTASEEVGTYIGIGIAFAALSIAGVSTGLLFAGDRNRTLHDRMADTVCVAGRPVSRTAEAPLAAPAAQVSDVPAG